MTLQDIQAVYFVGAGGIGMSAIARYFLKKGLVVAGYDKTPSTLTRQLEQEGMLVHYEEDVTRFPRPAANPSRASSSIPLPSQQSMQSCSISARTASKYRSVPKCWAP